MPRAGTSYRDPDGSTSPPGPWSPTGSGGRRAGRPQDAGCAGPGMGWCESLCGLQRRTGARQRPAPRRDARSTPLTSDAPGPCRVPWGEGGASSCTNRRHRRHADAAPAPPASSGQQGRSAGVQRAAHLFVHALQVLLAQRVQRHGLGHAGLPLPPARARPRRLGSARRLLPKHLLLVRLNGSAGKSAGPGEGRLEVPAPVPNQAPDPRQVHTRARTHTQAAPLPGCVGGAGGRPAPTLAPRHHCSFTHFLAKGKWEEQGQKTSQKPAESVTYPQNKVKQVARFKIRKVLLCHPGRKPENPRRRGLETERPLPTSTGEAAPGPSGPSSRGQGAPPTASTTLPLRGGREERSSVGADGPRGAVATGDGAAAPRDGPSGPPHSGGARSRDTPDAGPGPLPRWSVPRGVGGGPGRRHMETQTQRCEPCGRGSEEDGLRASGRRGRGRKETAQPCLRSNLCSAADSAGRCGQGAAWGLPPPATEGQRASA